MTAGDGVSHESRAAMVRILDTTLRDGEQSPGCTMTCREKVAIARQLVRLRVDAIEAGFPASSPGDLAAVRAVAGEVGTSDGPVIAAFGRATERDIDACREALDRAVHRRIHIFLATSNVHLEHKLRATRPQIIDRAARMTAFARARCDDVQFSAEDATRSDRAFLVDVLRAVAEAGATVLNIPDTVGYATPEEYHALFAGVRAPLAAAGDVVLSAHCHDDLGLAVANTLAAVRAGARQVECTINGIGERAGNAALEEIAMALRVRHAALRAETGLETRELMRASRLVARCTGVGVPPNKAVVGANAFAHEAGIHQDGMLKHRQTYEIMHPEDVGAAGTRLVLGRHSGRHAFARRLTELGYALGDEHVTVAFARFKTIADRRKRVADRDVHRLIGELLAEGPGDAVRHGSFEPEGAS
jgi:2-isopropylmalate synthase